MENGKMTATDIGILELEKAGLLSKNSDYEGMVGEAVKELLLVFQKQGHSGYSAQLTASIFHKLIKGEPLSPLTSEPSEWMEVGLDILQNMRSSYVFIDKGKSNRPYTIDGKCFSDDGGKTYFTNIDSRVYFDLPGFPPKTEYIIIESKGE
jgi:hypothetical protein